MYDHTRVVTSARESGAIPTMAPSSGLGVTSCAMPPRTALDASAPAAPVRRGDGVLAARVCLALACLAWAIRDLLAREAASGGAQVCDGHGTRPTSPHAVDGHRRVAPVTRAESTLPKRVRKDKAGAPTGRWEKRVRCLRSPSCPCAHAVVVPKRPVCFVGECPALRYPANR